MTRVGAQGPVCLLNGWGRDECLVYGEGQANSGRGVICKSIFGAYALKDEFLKNAVFSVYNDTKTLLLQKHF